MRIPLTRTQQLLITLRPTKQILQGDTESKGSADSDSSRRSIRLLAILYTTIGLFLFYVASFRIHADSWKHFVESIGAAVFILGFVSLALEYKDLVNYTSWVLRKQLLNRDYIRTMSPEALRSLKLSVDEMILGASELSSKGGFYSFVANSGEEMLKMPYRSQMTDFSQFTAVPGNPGLLRKVTTTKYTFVKGFSGERPMTVQWEGNSLATGDKLLIGELRLTIRTKIWSLKEDGGSLSLCCGDDEITVDYRQDRTREHFPLNCFAFNYEIPQSAEYAGDQDVDVEIYEDSIVSKTDDTYYLRLSYPTRNLTVTCVLPEGSTTTANIFGFSPDPQTPLTDGGNVASVVLSQWSLPGNGIYISWRLPADWDQRVLNAIDQTAV